MTMMPDVQIKKINNAVITIQPSPLMTPHLDRNSGLKCFSLKNYFLNFNHTNPAGLVHMFLYNPHHKV